MTGRDGPAPGAAGVPSRPALPRPFLKWAGGKTRLLPELLRRVPDKFGTYYEPFLGGGALFWELRPRRAVLGDLNQELVAAYRGVQAHVPRVVVLLRKLFATHSPEQYAAVRAQVPSRLSPAQSAARTIYLNKTCFNGLYRVNKSGAFNVPIGRSASASPPRCDSDNLRACSAVLRGLAPWNESPSSNSVIGDPVVALVAADFRVLLAGAGPGDFAYLDPPYVPSSETSYFTAFTREGFGEKAQEELADLVVVLKRRGVRVLLSNSDTPETVELYERRGLRVERVVGIRSIGCRAEGRGTVGEILVT